MANTHSTLASLFTDIAKAIRSKTGSSASIVADQFPEAISGISVGVDTSDATASTGEILSGETAYVNGAKVTGTMANNGAVSQAINAGGSYTIPAGYHNGSGKVTGNSLASQTSANAAAGDIASGKTAWVNGSKVTGTWIPKECDSGELSFTETVNTATIPTNKKNLFLVGIPVSGNEKEIKGITMVMIINGALVYFAYRNSSSKIIYLNSGMTVTFKTNSVELSTTYNGYNSFGTTNSANNPSTYRWCAW